jgi:hypothetical protein
VSSSSKKLGTLFFLLSIPDLTVFSARIDKLLQYLWNADQPLFPWTELSLSARSKKLRSPQWNQADAKRAYERGENDPQFAKEFSGELRKFGDAEKAIKGDIAHLAADVTKWK